MLPQAGAFMLSALSTEIIKPAPLRALCASSAAGGEYNVTATDRKNKFHRRDAKIAKKKKGKVLYVP